MRGKKAGNAKRMHARMVDLGTEHVAVPMCVMLRPSAHPASCSPDLSEEG